MYDVKCFHDFFILFYLFFLILSASNAAKSMSSKFDLKNEYGKGRMEKSYTPQEVKNWVKVQLGLNDYDESATVDTETNADKSRIHSSFVQNDDEVDQSIEPTVNEPKPSKKPKGKTKGKKHKNKSDKSIANDNKEIKVESAMNVEDNFHDHLTDSISVTAATTTTTTFVSPNLTVEATPVFHDKEGSHIKSILQNSSKINVSESHTQKLLTTTAVSNDEANSNSTVRVHQQLSEHTNNSLHERFFVGPSVAIAVIIVIALSIGFGLWMNKKRQNERLRMQLLPVYNYDATDDQDDWEARIFGESSCVRSKEQALVPSKSSTEVV